MPRAGLVWVKPPPSPPSLWHLLAGAACLLGGSALVFQRRPFSGSALMCCGALLSLRTTAAKRVAVPALMVGGVGTFAVLGYGSDFEARRVQRLVALAQPRICRARPRVQFEDCLPQPYFHCLTRPKHHFSSFGLEVTMQVVGVERDSRTDKVQYVIGTVRARRPHLLADFEILSVDVDLV